LPPQGGGSGGGGGAHTHTARASSELFFEGEVSIRGTVGGGSGKLLPPRVGRRLLGRVLQLAGAMLAVYTGSSGSSASAAGGARRDAAGQPEGGSGQGK
jgi:hypothetical protein